MKTSTVGIVTPMNKEELKELFKETIETLATGLLNNKADNTTFAAVDLWKLRKNYKTSASLRRFF
jgi:hypothetical protein